MAKLPRRVLTPARCALPERSHLRRPHMDFHAHACICGSSAWDESACVMREMLPQEGLSAKELIDMHKGMDEPVTEAALVVHAKVIAQFRMAHVRSKPCPSQALPLPSNRTAPVRLRLGESGFAHRPARGTRQLSARLYGAVRGCPGHSCTVILCPGSRSGLFTSFMCPQNKPWMLRRATLVRPWNCTSLPKRQQRTCAHAYGRSQAPWTRRSCWASSLRTSCSAMRNPCTRPRGAWTSRHSSAESSGDVPSVLCKVPVHLSI